MGPFAASRLEGRRGGRPVSPRFRLYPGDPPAQFRPARHRARATRRLDPQPCASRSLRRGGRVFPTPPPPRGPPPPAVPPPPVRGPPQKGGPPPPGAAP